MKKFLCLFIFSICTIQVSAFDFRGSSGIETRYFTHYENFQSSLFVEPEIYWEKDNARQSITFKPFARWDEKDDERSHADIRELFYQYATDSVEVRAGINKIFWGVTESQHLVDIINQTDNLEGFDGEDKLGQPMIQLSVSRDWGVLDVFALPYFRERKFAGPDGHFNIRFELANGVYLADIQEAVYESDKEEHHLDTALRYSHTLGNWDFGINYFDGTQRDPLWLIGELNSIQQTISITPYYSQIQQWGADLQATLGAWLWKVELISRDLQSHQLTATTAGFEYTLYGIAGSGNDLGILLEISKNDNPDLSRSIAQNDIFIGSRYTWNDEQSSELLLGISRDLDNQSYAVKIEANRRLGENYKISLDSWFFGTDDRQDILYTIRKEDFVQLSLEYYF